MGGYSPLRLDTQCMLASAVNYPYFSWLLLVLFLPYSTKVLLLLKTLLNLRWTSPKETVKGSEHVCLQEMELILCFHIHYRSGSQVTHGSIQYTRLEGFIVLLIYLV